MYFSMEEWFFQQLLAFFFTHQMALSLFRFIGAAGRTMVITNSLGTFVLLIVYVLGGFVISKDDLQPWWTWGYWASPMMYGQSAVSINEFLDPRWNIPNNDSNIDASTVGKVVLKSRGLSVNGYFYWISIGALIGFSILFNACFILSLTYLNPIGNSRAVIVNEDAENKSEKSSSSNKLMPNPAEEGEFSTTNIADVDVSPRKGNSGIANTVYKSWSHPIVGQCNDERDVAGVTEKTREKRLEERREDSRKMKRGGRIARR